VNDYSKPALCRKATPGKAKDRKAIAFVAHFQLFKPCRFSHLFFLLHFIIRLIAVEMQKKTDRKEVC
jgi:hypothetical protein